MEWSDIFGDIDALVRDSIWFLILVVVMVFVDLRFGVKAAKIRGEKVRTSGAMRRTMSKFFDYISWVLLAFVLGRALGAPLGIDLLPYLVMIYAIVLELDSIGSHWVEIHGIRLRSDKGKPISFLRYLLLVLAGQSSRAIERIVDNKEEEKDNAENEQNTDE